MIANDMNLNFDQIRKRVEWAEEILEAVGKSRYEFERLLIERDAAGGLNVYFDNRCDTGRQFRACCLGISANGNVDTVSNPHIMVEEEDGSSYGSPWENWLFQAYRKEVKPQATIHPIS
jgi:hypothetical protein